MEEEGWRNFPQGPAAFIETLPGSELKYPLCLSLGWYPLTGLGFTTWRTHIVLVFWKAGCYCSSVSRDLDNTAHMERIGSLTVWHNGSMWFFSTLIYTFSYCIHTCTRVQTHSALCCHTDSGGIRWWWEQSMRLSTGDLDMSYTHTLGALWTVQILSEML